MVCLANDFLFFRLPSGESVPVPTTVISSELLSGVTNQHTQELLSHAAASVFHYFKHDLGCQAVTVAEFAATFEVVLAKLGFRPPSPPSTRSSPAPAMQHLPALAASVGAAGELAFFPRLRAAAVAQCQSVPKVVRFSGLRPCVKQLLGAERWSPRCERLRDQILAFLRGVLRRETTGGDCALLIR
ncbi:MAG TPA: hypothetical protein PKN95_09665 [Verrucomicrobiota bacterium]|nr:hypothetical protein [Verrucomicrobiota bacterium]HNT15780.1 hypothetical protein [Verrucomicrobiota bacterium]